MPLGLLYVASIIKRCGHEAQLYDPYVDDYDLGDLDRNNYKKLDDIIENYKPDIIGFGGIATSYGRTKKLSLYLHNNYPDIFQIAGGPLSSVYDLLLTRTKVDLVFHGETESSFPNFIKIFDDKKSWGNIEGISFYRDHEIIITKHPLQINDLDTIPLPEYQLIDLPNYYIDIKNMLESYKFYAMGNQDIINRINSKKYYLPIISSRGCTHKCLFCYRHMRGVRQHSVNYVIHHIKYLQQTYGIDGFQFCDELFNSNPNWVIDFCDAIERENLDIIYLIGGARVDKVNSKMLYRLKETGCIEINYGHESGSDTILKEYGKGVNSNMNREITILSQKIGLHTPIQLVIGSPSETSQTIYETIRFLADVGAHSVSLHYLIPLPMTPIWKYVERNGLIKDVGKYLDSVAENDVGALINLTKIPDEEWRNWQYLISIQVKLNYMKTKTPILYYILNQIVNILNKISPSLLVSLIKLYRHLMKGSG